MPKRIPNQAVILVWEESAPGAIPLSIGPFENMAIAESFEKLNREDLMRNFTVAVVELLSPFVGLKSFLMDKVYALMNEGKTNREIAKELGVKVADFRSVRIKWHGWSKPGYKKETKK